MYFLSDRNFKISFALIPLVFIVLTRIMKYHADKTLKECQSIVDFVSFRILEKLKYKSFQSD